MFCPSEYCLINVSNYYANANNMGKPLRASLL